MLLLFYYPNNLMMDQEWDSEEDLIVSSDNPSDFDS